MLAGNVPKKAPTGLPSGEGRSFGANKKRQCRRWYYFSPFPRVMLLSASEVSRALSIRGSAVLCCTLIPAQLTWERLSIPAYAAPTYVRVGGILHPAIPLAPLPLRATHRHRRCHSLRMPQMPSHPKGLVTTPQSPVQLVFRPSVHLRYGETPRGAPCVLASQRWPRSGRSVNSREPN